MKVERTAAAAFLAEFESEDELREEHRLNLSQSALRLVTTESVALHTTLAVTLRGPSGAETNIRATVVAALPDGIALAVNENGDEILQRLLAQDKNQNTWDRIRALSQMEKLLLAVKAERSERALLLQDNDPRVLLSLLRNPRITVEEVARMAKSSFLTYQIADVIMKAAQWMSSIEVRQALIHNPKTPQAFALRILPTLPDADVRAIARAGTNMVIKQAALRRLQGK
ncbi:MAG TPA: hypothetical protein VMU84_13315 [Thermoanaerobaculia bacterium]|nr:hypothetical protein [Thermoanaerobaculia bacterium]